jgi:hypothetical protein
VAMLEKSVLFLSGTELRFFGHPARSIFIELFRLELQYLLPKKIPSQLKSMNICTFYVTDKDTRYFVHDASQVF